MEFNFDVEIVLKCNQDGISIIDGSQPYKYRKSGALNISKNANQSSSIFKNSVNYQS
jgi:hypothetical protein